MQYQDGFYFQNILLMILQEVSQSSFQHLTKIKFLETEKQQLLDQTKSLEYSLQLNKIAMRQFTNLLNDKYNPDQTKSVLIKSIVQLQEQKKVIRQENKHLKQQIQSLKCEVFINSQIKQESDQEYLSVMKNYQQKILELRRIIQDKQYAIQQKESSRKQKMNINEDVFPRYDLVNMQIKAEETLRLVRILTNQNNKLYSQIKCICQDLAYTDTKLSEEDDLTRKSEKILILKNKIEKIKSYFNNLEEKRMLIKSNMEIHGEVKIRRFSKQNMPNQQSGTSKSKTKAGYVNQSLVSSSLRQLLFKQKKNTQILKKELEQQSSKLKQLRTTNKLLTQSNINYQTKRGQIKSELQLYKHKYTNLVNLILETRKNSFSKEILRELKKENTTQIRNKFSFKKRKNQDTEVFVAREQSEKQWCSSLMRHAKIPLNFRKSKSCILDDVWTETLNIIEKEQQPQNNVSNFVVESSFNEPFSINYSVIEPN